MKDAAQATASEWQKASDQISQSLSDSCSALQRQARDFFDFA